MVRVLFDHEVFLRAPYGGISRYVCELANRLDQLPDCRPRVAAFFNANKMLSSIGLRDRISISLPSLGRFNRVARPINNLATMALLTVSPPDVVHQSHYNVELALRWHGKMVSTAHDMIHNLFPQYFHDDTYARAQELVFKRSDLIIAVSHWTKNDMVERFGYDPQKIAVVHHGVSFAAPLGGPPRHRQPYILFVGQRTLYKNFGDLLTAVASSPKLTKEYRIVAFGGGEFSTGEREVIRRHGLIGRVVHDSGDDEVLADCYRNAALFVYPSLYEGFGMPLLEAMAQGCPVACSNSSCFPEIAGDAAQYFDPRQPDSIAHAIISVLEDPERRDALKAAGYEQVRSFSWERSAREHMNLYEQILS